MFNGFVAGVVEIGVLSVVNGISCLSIDIESIANVCSCAEREEWQTAPI